MTKKLFLFDCDGTILDSVSIIHDSMVRTFGEAGYALPSQAQTRSIIGLTLNLAIARLLKRHVNAEVETMTTRYKQHFHAIYNQPDFSQSLFDGMGDLITGFVSHDRVDLGIVTGKSRRGMDMFFDKHGFRNDFKIIRTADDCPSKPHPAMVLECCADMRIAVEDTVVIGDSVFDMEMAKAAGAQAIGVAWGYNEVPLLRAAGADAIAGTADELKQILEASLA
ncbi:MAG: HAD-IA family hydrolase [Rhizobiaceae bacterium]